MLESFGALYLAVGPPIVLLAGSAATALAAAAREGRTRWISLAIGPLLTLLAAYFSVTTVVRFIRPAEGSGFLLGGAAMGLYLLALLVYYPALALVGLILWRRRSR